jgi:HEAT repeat protein
MAFPDLQRKGFEGYKLPVIVALIVISLLLELIVHWYLGIEVVYSHFFYVPMVLAGIWYGMRGVWVAVFLGGVLIAGTYVTNGVIDAGSVIRALMFVLVALVIGFVSDMMRKEQGRMIGEVADAAVRSGLRKRGDTFADLKSRVISFAGVRRLKERGDTRGLIRALRNRDHGVQYEAAEALGELRDPAAIPALMGALTGDQYSGIRWKAAEALAKIGTPSVPSLIGVVDNPDADIRWKAAVTLGEIGDPRAIPPLIAMLSDKDRFVRSRAVYALILIGPPAVGSLSEALNHGNADVRQSAVTALGKIGDLPAISALVHALGDPSAEVRQEAVSALAGQGKKAFAAISAALYDQNDLVRQGAALALAGTGDEKAIPLLRQALVSADPETEKVLLSAIRDIEARGSQ